jgi:hypothetical protein
LRQNGRQRHHRFSFSCHPFPFRLPQHFCNQPSLLRVLACANMLFFIILSASNLEPRHPEIWSRD